MFFIFVLIVQLALLVKCPLYIIKQVSEPIFLSLSCPNQTEPDYELSNGQFEITIVVYEIAVIIGRYIEALIIHIHIYRFFFGNSSENTVLELMEILKWSVHKSRVKTAFLILLLVYIAMHCLTIPLFGLAIEIIKGRKLHQSCEKYTYDYNVLIWICEVAHYLNDASIHSLLVFATIAVKEIWTTSECGADDNHQSPGLANSGYVHYNPNSYQEIHVHNEPDHGDQSEPDDSTTPKLITEYIEDRNIIAKDLCTRINDYNKKGEKARHVLETFKTWFVIPWIVYFIASSLNVNDILKAFRAGDGSHSKGHYDLTDINFIVYNFNRIMLLTLAFLCSKKMNSYHHTYLMKSQHQQVNQYKAHEHNKIALAYIYKIKKEKHFDFVPRLLGTSIAIPIDNPVYVITLLLGLFFTVVRHLSM